MLGRFFGGREGERRDRLAPYGVDVREDADHLYVEAELPGFRKDDVDITLENQTLTIAAERKDETTGTTKQGRPAPPRAAVQPLPPKLHPAAHGQRQTVNAKLADGVLTVTLNKREETKPRKIQVS